MGFKAKLNLIIGPEHRTWFIAKLNLTIDPEQMIGLTGPFTRKLFSVLLKVLKPDWKTFTQDF